MISTIIDIILLACLLLVSIYCIVNVCKKQTVPGCNYECVSCPFPKCSEEEKECLHRRYSKGDS